MTLLEKILEKSGLKTIDEFPLSEIIVRDNNNFFLIFFFFINRKIKQKSNAQYFFCYLCYSY